MNTPEGAAKMKQTMIKQYGSYEAYCQHLKARSSKGGKAKGRKGFAALSKEHTAAAGRKGSSVRWNGVA